MPNRTEAQRVLQFLLDSAPVIVHLRIQEVLPFLLKDSHYRNFYETNATNTMSTQSDRLQWDALLFDGLYDDNTAPHERIKFGLLDVGFAQNSDVIRKTIARLYGWSRLELKPSVRWRCTYSIGDSGIVKGTPNLTVLETLVTGQWRSQEMRPLVLAAAVAAAVGKDGEEDVKERLEKDRIEQRRRMKEGRGIRRWEKQSSVSYIEAQIHGPIDLSTDVEALIVDKYYQNNETMLTYLDAFTDRFGVPYRWTEEEIGEIPYDAFGREFKKKQKKVLI
jgi:hypothetical protein